MICTKLRIATGRVCGARGVRGVLAFRHSRTRNGLKSVPISATHSRVIVASFAVGLRSGVVAVVRWEGADTGTADDEPGPFAIEVGPHRRVEVCVQG